MNATTNSKGEKSYTMVRGTERVIFTLRNDRPGEVEIMHTGWDHSGMFSNCRNGSFPVERARETWIAFKSRGFR